jgi:hypothetical protein
VCMDFVGDALSEQEKESGCTDGGGIAGAEPCPTENLVGSCELGSGAGDVVYRFYSDTTPPFDAAMAEHNCNNLNGTFLP